LTQDDQEPTADADANGTASAMLADGNENDEDLREFVASHQSLPEWYHRAQVGTQHWMRLALSCYKCSL
jgi:hypothetical protein